MKLKYLQICFLCCLVGFVMFMASCSLETYATKKNVANQEILSYLADNKIDVKPNESGLVYIQISDGVGKTPKLGDKVAFHYKGYYLNGDVFDSSYGKKYPLIVELGNEMVISGLEEALLLMNKGSKAKVVIPFYLAYDDMENAPVPPYTNLVFEIEMIDFTAVKE